MEHLQHFGLSQDPFGNEPDLRFYFDSARHRDAMMRVERGLRQNKGLTVLTGAPGTGKTLLARRLLESLEEEVFEVSLLVMLPGATDAQSVLARFARQLGVENPGTDRSTVLARIYEQLAIVREEGRHGVLIIDDAHFLAADAMAEIGALLGMEYEESRLLSLLLVGTPELDECMSSDAALHQRVDVRVQLQSLGLDGTAAYLAHRLSVVGGRGPLMPSPTIEALYKFGRGRPRLINTLADNALFEAYLCGRTQVEAGDVERAAADLGVGIDPGTTFAGPPVPAMADHLPPPETALAPAPVAIEVPAPTPEQTAGEPALELGEPIAEPDLASLLDVGDSANEELTTLLATGPEEQSATFDLDAEVNAVLSEREDAVGEPELPSFEAENTAASAMAEATLIALPEEGDSQGPGEVADLDDVFVELIEE